MVYVTVKLFCEKAVVSRIPKVQSNVSKCHRIRSRSIYLVSLAEQNRYSKFVDSLRFYVRGGSGGTGFPRYGGIGGKGGDIYVEAIDKIRDLRHLRDRFPEKRFIAGSGEDSRKYRIMGLPGKDASIPCPVGVQILTEDGRVLGELNKEGDKVLVAVGGRGGDQLNQFNGMTGQKQTIVLDLKLIADVGFVGYPNAGKSTLLKAISRASPKIASYPFTTINPNIGIVEFPDFRKMSCADLPGLIEGAHANHGLGHRFLKHVERTKLLLFVVDVNGFQFGPAAPLRSPIETILYLNKELELYNEMLHDKPAILAVSKMDTKQCTKEYEKFLDQLKSISAGNFDGYDEATVPIRFKKFDDIIPFSSLTAYNIPLLRERMRDIIDFHYDEDQTKKGRPMTYRDVIERERNVFKDMTVPLV